MESLRIVEVREVDPLLEEAVARLLPQLSSRPGAPDRGRLCALAASSSSALLIARIGERIVGMLTLVWYDTALLRRAWIEDVVVDGEARGAGAGEALVRAALERAAAVGAEQVMLTSSPARLAARALYRKVGFAEAETTLFRLRIGPEVPAPGER